MRSFRTALDDSSAVLHAPAAGSGADPPLGVRVERLSKSFAQAGGPLPVLDGITLDVAPGSFISLLGPSGAGKSTLLGILASLDSPTAGTVSLYTAAGEVA